MTGTYGPKHKLFTPCATRTIIFQIESNLIVWFTQCASFFFFQHVFFFCQYVCRALFVEILCNKTSQQVTINPLSLNIHIQILPTDLYIFP